MRAEIFADRLLLIFLPPFFCLNSSLIAVVRSAADLASGLARPVPSLRSLPTASTSEAVTYVSHKQTSATSSRVRFREERVRQDDPRQNRLPISIL